MIKIFAIVLSLMGFIAVALTADPAATDGYIFEGKQFTNQDIRVRMVYYDDLDDLQLEADIRGFADSQLIMAFAQSDREYCEIHTMDPEVEYKPERYGHELMHCIHGNWHFDQFVVILPGEGMPNHED